MKQKSTPATKKNPQKLMSQRQVVFFIAGCMIFSAALSFFFFLGQSLRLDEAQSLWQTSRSPQKVLNIIAQDVHVPFYHIMLHAWQSFFGNNVVTARVFSLIFFLASIPALYKLASLNYSQKSSLYVTLLFSVSPFMNWYGNEIRMYSVFTLLILLNQFYFISLFKHRDEEQRQPWVKYGITAILGIYTHYFFFFALVSQVVFYFLNRDIFSKNSLKKFAIVLVSLIASFTPWALYVFSLGTINNSSPLLIVPNSTNVFNTFSQFLFGFQTNAINTILVSLWPLTVLFGFLALRKKATIRPETTFFIVSFLTPVILAFTVSVFVRPLFLSRYLILTLPSLYILLTWISATYPETIRKLFRGGLVAIMLITLSIQVTSALTPVKENYLGASLYLAENATASDTIIVSAPFTIYPVEYYYRGPAVLTTIPGWDRREYGPIPPFNEENLPIEVENIKNNSENMWVLLSYDQGYEEKVRMYFDNNYERLDVQTFSPGLRLYKYKARYE